MRAGDHERVVVMFRNLPNRYSPFVVLNLCFMNDLVQSEPSFQELLQSDDLFPGLGDWDASDEEKQERIAALVVGSPVSEPATSPHDSPHEARAPPANPLIMAKVERGIRERAATALRGFSWEAMGKKDLELIAQEGERLKADRDERLGADRNFMNQEDIANNDNLANNDPSSSSQLSAWRNADAAMITGPWDAVLAKKKTNGGEEKKCTTKQQVIENFRPSLLSRALDPRILKFVDFFHQPQNLKGYNLGYAFARFRSYKVAERFMQIMGGVQFPEAGSKLLELCVSTSVLQYKFSAGPSTQNEGEATGCGSGVTTGEEDDTDKTPLFNSSLQPVTSRRRQLHLATRFWFDVQAFPMHDSLSRETHEVSRELKWCASS